MKGFQRFRDEFEPCLMQGFPNAYFIANSDSMTTPRDYLAFCERVGLRYDILDMDAFSPIVREVALGITTDEVVYDCGVLRTLVLRGLDAAGVKPHYGADVSRITRDGSRYTLEISEKLYGPFDAVVNCTYANINLLNAQLGHAAPTYQYEYTMVPIIEWNQPPVGVTVMDGRFMTVLPFGQTGRFLLYHVEHTVVATEIGSQMPIGWLDPKNSPSQQVNAQYLFNTIKQSCSRFVPALQDARLAGFLQGPRMVLANRDSTDARPSIINRHEPGYWSVFTGKIDHCMWVADEIANTLGTR
jgi:glycine/D-amino acid oxidase-like deaminating enzyme